MTDDMTPVERQLIGELSRLAVDPTPSASNAILLAVRSGLRVSEPQPQRGPRWRLPLAGAAAATLVLAGTVGSVAASSEALPHSPTYTLRLVGEDVRLAVATPLGREELRIQFARDRFHQARHVVSNSPSDAHRLLEDGSEYLNDTRHDLPSLSTDEQGQVQSQLNQAGDDQKAAQDQLNQEGEQGNP